MVRAAVRGGGWGRGRRRGRGPRGGGREGEEGEGTRRRGRGPGRRWRPDRRGRSPGGGADLTGGGGVREEGRSPGGGAEDEEERGGLEEVQGRACSEQTRVPLRAVPLSPPPPHFLLKVTAAAQGQGESNRNQVS